MGIQDALYRSFTTSDVSCVPRQFSACRSTPSGVHERSVTIICIVLSQVLPCSFSQEGNEWDALGRQGLSNVLRKTPPLLPIVELSVSVELRCDLIVWDMVPHSFSTTGMHRCRCVFPVSLYVIVFYTFVLKTVQVF